MKYSFFYILSGLILFSCATHKSRQDISKLGKLYHNVTAKYNGYFNANVLYEESKLKLQDQYQENYNKSLPLYKYTEADNPESVASDLDEAIKKVSIVATLHEQSQ